MKRQLISSAEAVPAKGQHEHPCSDCPLARDSVNGWLGSDDPETWISMLHGETRIECHTMIGAQCAGAAIYRANVFEKFCRRLEDRLRVARQSEQLRIARVLQHHKGEPKMTRLMKKTDTSHHTEGLAFLLRELDRDRALTKAEYLDVLCEMAAEIETRIDAAREELDP